MKHAPLVLLAAGVLVGLFFLGIRACEGTEVRPIAMPVLAPHEPEAPLPDGFVPNLPEVPDLSRPRPERTTSELESDRLMQEMNLLHEARGLLGEDPTGALALLEQHAARFPEGALCEQREAYTLLAMIQLGRPEGEVERRYLELLADYPQSSFVPDIRRAMDASREAHAP